jgi:hypothetical protein
MFSLTSNFTEIRPAMCGSIFHLDKPLGTARILVDTGAIKTAISHQFFLENKIEPIGHGTTKTPYGKDVPTAIYSDIKVILLGDNGTTHELKMETVEAIIGSEYDFPVIFGMEVLNLGKFTLWGEKRDLHSLSLKF